MSLALPLVLGIDPGISGGFSVLDNDGKVYCRHRFESWWHARCQIYPVRQAITLACIEKVQSSPAQGVRSAFTFGANYGGWLALLEVYRIPYELVPPGRWQKKFLGHFPAGESKARSLAFINRRYPSELQLKKKDDGIADSMCLALYAMYLHRRLHKYPTT